MQQDKGKNSQNDSDNQDAADLDESGHEPVNEKRDRLRQKSFWIIRIVWLSHKENMLCKGDYRRTRPKSSLNWTRVMMEPGTGSIRKGPCYLAVATANVSSITSFGIGKYPSLTTISWPCLESTNFKNSAVSLSRGSPGFLFT